MGEDTIETVQYILRLKVTTATYIDTIIIAYMVNNVRGASVMTPKKNIVSSWVFIL